MNWKASTLMTGKAVLNNWAICARTEVLESTLETASNLASRSMLETKMLNRPFEPKSWQQYVQWTRQLYKNWSRPMRQLAFAQSPVTACWPGAKPFCAEVIAHSTFQRIWHAILLKESWATEVLDENLGDGEACKNEFVFKLQLQKCLAECEHLTMKQLQFEQIVMRFLEHQPSKSAVVELFQSTNRWTNRAVEIILHDYHNAAPADKNNSGELSHLLGLTGETLNSNELILPMEPDVFKALKMDEFQSQPRAALHRTLLQACLNLCVE